MSHFSDTLKRLMEQQSLDIPTLARESRVERTSVYKMVSGERKPSEVGIVKKLIKAMLLTQEEEKELMEAYKVGLMGESIYSRRLLMQNFFDKFELQGGEPQSGSMIPCTTPLAFGKKTFYGKQPVNNLITKIICSEAAKPEGKIQMVVQPDTDYFFSLLSLLGMNNQNLTIEHAVCFENHVKEQNGQQNIGYLQQMMSLLVSGCKYRPRYYYDSVSSHFGISSIMPYLIITSECILVMASDYTQAIVTMDQDMINFYGKLFTKIYNNSKPLTDVFPSLPETLLSLQDITDTIPVVELNSQPCIFAFITEDIIKKCLVKDYDGLLPSILEYHKKLWRIGWCKQIKYCYFSEQGLNYFLETGRLKDISNACYSPVELNDRYVTLDHIYNAVLNGSYQLLLIRSDMMRIPLNLGCYLKIDGRLTFLYNLITKMPSEDRVVEFSIDEQSIVDTIGDFLQYIAESDLVYSHEETVEFLRYKLAEGAKYRCKNEKPTE